MFIKRFLRISLVSVFILLVMTGCGSEEMTTAAKAHATKEIMRYLETTYPDEVFAVYRISSDDIHIDGGTFYMPTKNTVHRSWVYRTSDKPHSDFEVDYDNRTGSIVYDGYRPVDTSDKEPHLLALSEEYSVILNQYYSDVAITIRYGVNNPHLMPYDISLDSFLNKKILQKSISLNFDMDYTINNMQDAVELIYDTHNQATYLFDDTTVIEYTYRFRRLDGDPAYVVYITDHEFFAEGVLDALLLLDETGYSTDSMVLIDEPTYRFEMHN